jgi:hypothetical protein
MHSTLQNSATAKFYIHNECPEVLRFTRQRNRLLNTIGIGNEAERALLTPFAFLTTARKSKSWASDNPRYWFHYFNLYLSIWSRNMEMCGQLQQQQQSTLICLFTSTLICLFTSTLICLLTSTLICRVTSHHFYLLLAPNVPANHPCSTLRTFALFRFPSLSLLNQS